MYKCVLFKPLLFVFIKIFILCYNTFYSKCTAFEIFKLLKSAHLVTFELHNTVHCIMNYHLIQNYLSCIYVYNSNKSKYISALALINSIK